MPHLLSPPGICLLSTFHELYPFIFYRHYTMAEYAFFSQKADRWRKDMAPLWGNLNICPQLHWLKLPCHSQVELSSMNGLKSEGRDKNPAMTLLSCWFGYRTPWGTDIMDSPSYGWTLVKSRLASMKEAVGKLTACTSSGTNWPYALVWLHEGTHPHTTPQGQALGCPTSERGRDNPLWADQPT